MKVAAKNIETFFNLAGLREPDLRKLDALITQTVPHLERSLFTSPSMNGIAYGMYHYKYASGREGDWPLISLTNQKNYLSLYVSAMKDDKYLPEIYGSRLGKVSVGKSCIRVKKIDDINVEAIKQIVREAADWLAAQPKP